MSADQCDHELIAKTDGPPSYTAQPVSVAQLSYAVALPQVGLPSKLHPHNYLVLSLVVAMLCGIFSLFTLFCSVPAIVLSFMSQQASKQGRYARGKLLGNISAGLSIAAVTFGVLVAIVLFVILWYNAICLFTVYSHLCR